jgi:hypothetical protein
MRVSSETGALVAMMIGVDADGVTYRALVGVERLQARR